jgi:hypothetical protein
MLALAGFRWREIPSTRTLRSDIVRKFILSCASLCAMVLLFSACPLQAQTVLYVSPTGSDANSCGQSTPCATFQRAINLGAAQISCLGSGNYATSTLNISSSITIDCGTGNVGNMAVTSGNAITITSSPTVVPRHLSINGFRTGNSQFGIYAAIPSGTLIVEDCMIQGFNTTSSYGIGFSTTAGRGQLQVSNSQIFNNTGGITVFPSNGQIDSVTLNGVELVINMAYGLVLTGTGVVAGTMRNSVVGETAYGVYVDSPQAYFSIEDSSVVANTTAGIYSQSPGAVINVGTTAIGANGVGVSINNGSIVSFGNNQFSANGFDGTFTSTKALK